MQHTHNGIMKFTSPHSACRRSQEENRCAINNTKNDSSTKFFTDCSTTASTASLSSSSGSSKTKRVRFRVSQFMYAEPPPESCPPVDPSELFYTKDELEDICTENRAILCCIQRDAYCYFCDDVNSPARGLEDRTWEGARRRYCNQRNACQAVLNEQDRQRKKAIYEPYVLADIYKLFSKCCKKEAAMTGVRDARVAKKAFECELTSKETEGEKTMVTTTTIRSCVVDDENRLIKLPPSPQNMFLEGCIRDLFGLHQEKRKYKSNKSPTSIQCISL